MTAEDDFQQQLDKNPDDYQTRLVFADWLQEQGDKRAEGYRAMGMLRLMPRIFGDILLLAQWYGPNVGVKRFIPPSEQVLPDDWFMAIEGMVICPHCDQQHNNNHWSRREAEDAAAMAFSKLPATRRAELLAQPVLTT